jgi:DNA polymerase-3 subunit alpha (Gram-positive type)
LAFYATYFSIRPESFDIHNMLAGPEHIKVKLTEIKSKLKNPHTKKDVKKKDRDLVVMYEVVIEMYARGFSFANIDLLHSHATKFSITKDNRLLIPFSAIDGLGDIGAQSIVTARNQAPFASKQDLLERTKISTTILDYFEKLGITNNLNEDDQLRLF